MLYKTRVFLENRKFQISIIETRFSIIRDPVLFLQFIKCYSLDINAWDRGFLAKKCKNCNEKAHIETSYIYFDNAFINIASKNS